MSLERGRPSVGRPWATWLVALLVCALAVSCTSAPAATRGPRASEATPNRTEPAYPSGPALAVRVMSYNVLGGPVPDDWFTLIPRSEVVPITRAPATVAKVRAADPDVAAFQEFEAGSEAMNRIEQDLSDYTWLHGPAYHAMIVRTSRFEVLDTGEAKLNSIGEEGSYFDRYVSWARLRDRSSGRTLLVLNFHGHPWQTPEIAAIRSLAIGRLVEVLERLDPGLAEPLVLLGDFNAASTESRPVFNDHLVKLRIAGLVDTARVARKDASDVPRANSLHQMSGKVAGRWVAKVVRRAGKHIDYVWVPSGTRVDTWQVLSGPGVRWQQVRGERVPVWQGIIPSDHSPVVADVRFARA